MISRKPYVIYFSKFGAHYMYLNSKMLQMSNIIIASLGSSGMNVNAVNSLSFAIDIGLWCVGLA